MGFRVYFSIYNGWINWNHSIKLFTRYYTSRHLLRGSTLPLCTENGGCICHLCSIYTLIPTSIWPNTTYTMSKCSILPYIPRGKSYFLPPTLFRIKGNTSTIFRLPWCFYKMKCGFLTWVTSIVCGINIIYLHFMRSICLSTKGGCQSPPRHIYRMSWYHTTTRLPQP